jgi:hypothetical protein
MMPHLLLSAVLALPPGPQVLAAAQVPQGAQAEDFARVLRALLLANLPDPLVQSQRGWGQTKEVWNGTKWRGQGIGVHAVPQRKAKNHGTWRRIRVSVDRPEATLRLAVGNLQRPEPGRLTFDVFVACDANLLFEQQIWDAGVRLYSGETRARCKVLIGLKCESVTRVEKGPGLLPDAVIRLRVLDSYLHYDELVVEHTAGVGGTAAKVLGDAVIGLVREVRPDLERELRERANAAIVKAGDTKEVRLSLSKLIPLGGR